MKRSFFLLILLSLTLTSSAQKSRVLSVMQMIDAERYSDAKEAIELAVWNDRTANWHRTYYAKGLLCQRAYEEGVKKKDNKLLSLYEDQLFLAYDSYQKAIELDAREKIHSAIAKLFYPLSNDFRQLGLEQYTKKEFSEALRAFEYALLVLNSDLINVPADTNLVYNAAMAAYESGSWDKAIEYLSGLHKDAFDTNASLFLVNAHLHQGDTLQAEAVMREGIQLYEYSDTVVMNLVNWLSGTGRKDQAIVLLNDAIEHHPDKHRFHWALGLVYSDLEKYPEAIISFKEAAELSSEKPPELYYQVGVCYYNMGIDLREAAMQISENEKYMEVRDQYLDLFREAVQWLEKSYELDPDSERTITRLYQLYFQLQMKEKQDAFEQLIQ